MGVPHHVIQRGNRRQPTFFGDEDYEAYIGLMAEWCSRCGVAVWAYCLMTDHVHLIVVPSSEVGLRSAIGEAHRRYSRRINSREGLRGSPQAHKRWVTEQEKWEEMEKDFFRTRLNSIYPLGRKKLYYVFDFGEGVDV